MCKKNRRYYKIHTLAAREFVCLGKVITNDDKECVTDHQIAKATAKFNELRKVLTDINVNMITRTKLLETCVRSRLT